MKYASQHISSVTCNLKFSHYAWIRCIHAKQCQDYYFYILVVHGKVTTMKAGC